MNIWLWETALVVITLLVLAGIKYRYHLTGFLSTKPDIIQAVESPPAKYLPHVLDHLVLPGAVNGIVGIRQWTYLDSILTSRNQKYIWTSSNILADKVPTKDNQSGIYAYQLGSMIPSWAHHIGIVEMLDHIQVHSDGVIRAEKCKILVIIVNWGNSRWAREVSSRYNIPVYIANYPGQAFQRWLLGPDGMKWLNHNYYLLNEVKFNIIEEAEKMLGAKQ